MEMPTSNHLLILGRPILSSGAPSKPLSWPGFLQRSFSQLIFSVLTLRCVHFLVLDPEDQVSQIKERIGSEDPVKVKKVKHEAKSIVKVRQGKKVKKPLVFCD